MMAKWPPYPDYRETAERKLPVIPSHWRLSKAKYVAEYINGFAFKPADWGEEGTPIIRIQNLTDANADINRTNRSVPDKYRVESGDMLISWSASLSVHTWDREDAWLNQHIFKVVPDERIVSKGFLVWLSKWFVGELDNETHGSTMQHVTWGKFGSAPVAFPLIEEQREIAAFLDHETAKIDRLIAKQERLIELLKEKRQAVISHAVTKGLNPDAPMKDSGVEWLGEVPAHWDVCLVKHKCKEITDGAHISPVTENGEHYFVSIRDIKDGQIDFEDCLLTAIENYEYLARTGCQPAPGDLLFSKDGTIGETAITPHEPEFVVASSLIIIKPNLKVVTPKFLDFLMQGKAVQEQVESFVKGAALRRLSIQNLLKVWGTFPPLKEQVEITNHLLSKLDRFAQLSERAQLMISLLKEHRTALISAAVTGKIDVRGWQKPNTEPEEAAEAASA
ncbi:MAG: restriction endonuclease subunit S [Chromatiales bacterium]|nr:restriction endonuclease subunit S [Chromatiales bacterium]